MNNWQSEHRKTINSFLSFLNSKTDNFILKGGTALLACYNLDRFSEDIDLDSMDKNIINYIDAYCTQNNFEYRIAKDTDTSRDRLRDLYDVCFICNKYYDQLSDISISLLRSAVEYKGIEHFDYIIQTQQDELIDTNKLASDFLETYNLLGLLYDKDEKQIISSYVPKNNKSDFEIDR